MLDLSHSFSVNVYRLPGTSHSFDEPAISQGDMSFHTWPTAEFPILLRTILSYTSYISHENPILKYCNYSLSHYMYIHIYPAKIAYIYIYIYSKIRKNRKYTYTIIYNNIDLCIIYIYMMLDS